jgi:hypothetical protein
MDPAQSVLKSQKENMINSSHQSLRRASRVPTIFEEDDDAFDDEDGC